MREQAQSERVHALARGGAEGEGKRNSRRLPVSLEPDAGLNLTTRDHDLSPNQEMDIKPTDKIRGL